jgi:hypothetical protein
MPGIVYVRGQRGLSTKKKERKKEKAAVNREGKTECRKS